MKKLVILPLFLMAFLANAQFKFGAGAGLNFSNLRGEVNKGTDDYEITGITGFNIGACMEIKAPAILGVEADVLFSTKGANIRYVYAQSDPTLSPIVLDADQKISYIDIPVVVKLYAAKVLSLQLGVQYSMLLGANYNDRGNKDSFTSSDVALVTGLGLDASLVHFSCRYNYGVSNVLEKGGELKNGTLSLTVGVWLKK
ncbi:MAG: PorT family protein [Flavobacteriales bacterium]|nr:PorT family protein [Flavobacteriales bacterium]